MKIDGSEKGLKVMDYYFNHPYEEYQALEEEILKDIAEGMDKGEDHCSCKMKCRWHGKCFECLMLHRAHQDHLPCCLWDMVKSRVEDPNGLTDHKNRTVSAQIKDSE